MAATGVVTLNANVTGGLDGSRAFGPITVKTTSAVTQTLSVSLSIGANTITLPSGTTACVLIPPNGANPVPNPAFSGTLTLKGVSGDTGIAISNTYPTMLSWDTSPSSIVINSTATGTLSAWMM